LLSAHSRTALRSSLPHDRNTVLIKKLFGIYFGGYSKDISGDFVSSFKEPPASYVTKKMGQKGGDLNSPEIERRMLRPNGSLK